MRIIFAGTPDFAVPALTALHAAGHEILAVYTQPDRPAGRGRKLAASPVKRCALELGIPVAQPENLRDKAARQQLAAYAPELMVVVAYGLLLPQVALDIPQRGCVNIHASLLPRWRGAAPIQRAIEAGDAESGVSIMHMEKGLDTGPVLLEKRFRLRPRETGGSLHDALAEVGAKAITEAVDGLAANALKPVAQSEQGVTYARKLEKAEAAIDWQQAADRIERRIRAFNPWPVCHAELDGERIRIWEAVALPEVAGEPGEIVAATPEGIDVAAGKGGLRILRLQAPGKNPMAARDFLNSRDPRGKRFA